MRFMRMPNGENVQIPEGATPEDIAALRAQYSPKSGDKPKSQADTMRTAPTPRQTRVQRRKEEIKRGESMSVGKRISNLVANPIAAVANTANDLVGGKLGAGFAFNFDDELRGAKYSFERNAPKLLRGQDTNFSRDYNTERDARREIKRDFETTNPGTALAAEIAGALANPLGTGGRAVYTAGRLLSKAPAAAKAGRALTRTAARMRSSSPLGKAVQAGAVQGAAQGAGASEELSDLPQSALIGAGTGALVGGALGGTAIGARRVAQIVRDRAPANAPRKAYERVGSLIGKAKDANGKKLTPAKVRERIATADSQGANMAVMDTVPSLRAEAAYLARSPNVPRSNDLQQFGEDRIAARNANFKDQVSNRATTGGQDLRDYTEGLDQTRRGIGSFDYREGGPMDNPVVWEEQGLDKFFREAGPTTEAVLKRAYNIMLDERRNPLELNMGDGTFTGVPTFRTLDYVKRGYDEIIESALGSGNRSQASRISKELSQLKSMLIDQNPEYGAILAAQRDPFQKKQAAEWGEWAFNKLTTEPRQVLRKIENEDAEVVDSVRIGIIDKLLNLDTKADPVSAIRAYMRNDAQRKVLEFAFGGKKEFDSFAKWVADEFEAVKSDAVTSTARNSVTSAVQLARDGAFGAAEEVGFQGLKGMAFGGTTGLFANAIRSLQNFKNEMTVDVQDEIARLLMSKGEDLEEGIAAAAKFMAARNKRNAQYGINVSKGVAAPMAAVMGSE